MTEGLGGAELPGRWLRRQREAAGLTQEELAARSGLSVRAISDLECGRTRMPHPMSVRLVTAALGLPETAADEAIVRGRSSRSARPSGPPQGATAAAAAPVDGGQERAGSSPVGVPRQLPAAVAYFAGRSAELAALDEWLAQMSGNGADGAVVISAIGGMAGVGKTALALHWAHRVAGKFPDGQLYVNLRGYDSSGQPARPAEVVRRFLDGLGVAPERILADGDSQAGLYRSVLAGKRVLIVADNARDAAQVRPLLPAAPGSLVLVTSRSPLAGLAATNGARLLNLDVLTAAEATGLLSARLGADRVAAEPEAVADLIRLCGQLPLALAVVAARAAASGWPLATLAAEIAGPGRRLDALDAGGDAAAELRAVFSWSCRQLSAAAARMFGLLGVHPGPDISAFAAASLAGLPLPQAQVALRELTGANLITERVLGRYGLHDLLRAFAAERVGTCDDQERQAAVTRMLDHYLYTAVAAARTIDPVEDIAALRSPLPGVAPEDIAGPDQALAWFTAEHKVLLAVTGQAGRDGFDRCARQLPQALVTFLDRRGHWRDLADSEHIALACAERLGDRAVQAQAHRDLGRAYAMLGDSDLALAHLGRAADLYERLGDLAGQARTHLMLSVTHESRRQLHDALASSLRALELAVASGHPVLRAAAYNNAGYHYAMLGEYRLARTYCERALEGHRYIDSPSLRASTWDSLGYIHHCLGDYRQATRSYLRALDLFSSLGSRHARAMTLSSLGDTHRAAGDIQSAHDAWKEAVAVLHDLSHPDASQVASKLHTLRTAMQNGDRPS